MAKNNILRWIGSKTHALDLLNNLIKKNYKNLIELYCGSAIISIELNKVFTFENSFCVDVDKNIINFYNDLKSNSDSIVEYYKSNYSDNNEDMKNMYYTIREKFNNCNNSLDWFFLNRTSISGMMRYNKGKFNSAFHYNRNGTKPKTIKKIIENNIKYVKKINFINDDSINFIENQEFKNSIFILDPPYFNSKNTVYFEGTNEQKLLKVLEKINETDNDFILFYGSELDNRTEELKYLTKNIYKTPTSKSGSFFRKINNDKSKLFDYVYTNF
jgi:DNA adenine methylase Dam